MHYRKYGTLGYDVSAFGMGCMRLPTTKANDGSSVVDLEAAYALIRYAADHGVTYFDTAYGYHDKQSESIVGEALAADNRRARVKIATKQPFDVMTDTAAIRKNLEATLKKLRTDYIDVYLVHNIMPHTWPKILERKVLAEYETFKKEGLINAIAFSYHGHAAGFRDVLTGYDWDMAQIQQNIIDTEKQATAAGMDLVGKKGCALVIMEPLRGGGLVHTPAPVKALYDAYPTRRTAVDWAFRHLLDHPAVTTVLSGVTTMEQLKDNIALFSAPDAVPGNLTAADKALLRDVKTAYESLAAIPCTACEYCLPCPQGVNIPQVFADYNNGCMYGSWDEPRRGYAFRAPNDASHCVACGACEAKCPQRISIIDTLQSAHAKLTVAA
jgi:predicted aldo/keto reductase-like oxidoreductase